jgi:hypothetical protein
MGFEGDDGVISDVFKQVRPTRAYTRTQAHARTCTYTQAHTQAHTHTYTHTHTHTHTRTHTHTHTRTHVHARTRSRTQPHTTHEDPAVCGCALAHTLVQMDADSNGMVDLHELQKVLHRYHEGDMEFHKEHTYEFHAGSLSPRSRLREMHLNGHVGHGAGHGAGSKKNVKASAAKKGGHAQHKKPTSPTHHKGKGKGEGKSAHAHEGSHEREAPAVAATALDDSAEEPAPPRRRSFLETLIPGMMSGAAAPAVAVASLAVETAPEPKQQPAPAPRRRSLMEAVLPSSMVPKWASSESQQPGATMLFSEQ